MRTPVALVATVTGVLIGFAHAAPAIAWSTEEAPRVDRPAVVFDIDDTALSNWEVIKANDFGRDETQRAATERNLRTNRAARLHHHRQCR